MLNFANQLKIFAYTRATDMRKGFAGFPAQFGRCRRVEFGQADGARSNRQRII